MLENDPTNVHATYELLPRCGSHCGIWEITEAGRRYVETHR